MLGKRRANSRRGNDRARFLRGVMRRKTTKINIIQSLCFSCTTFWDTMQLVVVFCGVMRSFSCTTFWDTMQLRTHQRAKELGFSCATFWDTMQPPKSCTISWASFSCITFWDTMQRVSNPATAKKRFSCTTFGVQRNGGFTGAVLLIWRRRMSFRLCRWRVCARRRQGRLRLRWRRVW